MADGVPVNPELLGAARSAAERHDWQTCLDGFRELRDPDTLAPDDLQLWATAAYLLGDVSTAATALTRAYHLFDETGRTDDAVRCGFWLVFLLFGSNEGAQANGWVATLASRVAEDADSQSVSRGYVLTLQAFREGAMEHRYEDARHSATTAQQIARASGDPDLLALALMMGGRACVRGQHTPDGFELADEAMVVVLSGRTSPMTAGTVYCSLIECCEEVSELRRGEEWTRALKSWSDSESGMVTFTGQCLTHRSRILHRRGDYDAAVAEAEEACKRFLRASDRFATGAARYQIGETLRIAGDHAAAEAAFDEAATWGYDPQPGLALLRLAQGRTDAARAALERALAERTDPLARVALLPAHVEIALRTGDIQAARTSADELDRVASAFGTEALLAQAAGVAGAVLLAEDDAARALPRLREAWRSWQSMPAPYDAARVRVRIAEACRMLGDDDTARREADAAAAAFAELGAVVDPPSAVGGKAGHGLSDREVEVLRLVATGMTNQAIADELYIAVRTVDRHLANIFAKLHVSSRTAATAFAYEHGLV